MKKILIVPLLLFALSFTAFRPVAEPFEGSIRYETTVSGVAQKTVSNRLAKYYEFKFKGNDVKIVGGAPLKGVIVVNNKSEKIYIIRDDQKNIYELDLKDKRIQESSLKPVVTSQKETATIAGYSCQKFNVKYSNGAEMHVWTTREINMTNWNSIQVFGGHFNMPDNVSGFPLKMELVATGLTVTGTATVVKSTSMDASEFELPKGLAIRKL